MQTFPTHTGISVPHTHTHTTYHYPAPTLVAPPLSPPLFQQLRIDEHMQQSTTRRQPLHSTPVQPPPHTSACVCLCLCSHDGALPSAASSRCSVVRGEDCADTPPVQAMKMKEGILMVQSVQSAPTLLPTRARALPWFRVLRQPAPDQLHHIALWSTDSASAPVQLNTAFSCSHMREKWEIGFPHSAKSQPRRPMSLPRDPSAMGDAGRWRHLARLKHIFCAVRTMEDLRGEPFQSFPPASAGRAMQRGRQDETGCKWRSHSKCILYLHHGTPSWYGAPASPIPIYLREDLRGEPTQV